MIKYMIFIPYLV